MSAARRAVLFVDSVSDVQGGAERSLLELASALRNRDRPVALATWRAGDLAAAFDAFGATFVLGAGEDPASPLGGATTRYPLLRPLVRSANALRLWLRPAGREAAWLASVVREAGAGLLHTNCDLSPVAAARAADAAGVPWVAHVRDDWRSWLHPRTARALRAADVVIAPSEFLASRFRAHGLDVTVVANPVAGRQLRRPLDPPARARIRGELRAEERDPPVGGPPGDPFLVAVVGRLDEQKGTLRIVEAAERLTATGDRGVRFLLAGEGSDPFERRLRAAIDAAGVGSRIRLLGHRADVSRWLPAMDALAVPSTGEPFGRMIVEGMHAGLPVLAFRSGAVPEILEHDRTGILLAEGDAARLAGALQELAGDPDRARRLGDAARSAAAAYEPDVIAGEMDRLYRGLVEG